MALCFIVDDHGDTREGFAEYLRDWGFDVRTAGDAVRVAEPSDHRDARSHSDGRAHAAGGRMDLDAGNQGKSAHAQRPGSRGVGVGTE